MLSYTLNLSRDGTFLASAPSDAITGSPLHGGDEICICDGCGAIYLQSSWNTNANKCYICGCGNRKDIDAAYLERKYRVPVHMVEGRGQAGAVTPKRRKKANSVERFDDFAPRVAADLEKARRRSSSAVNSNRRPSSTVNSNRRSSSTVNSNRRRVTPEPYPARTRKRKKTGRVLLALVLTLIVLAVFAVVMLRLHAAGVVDLTPFFEKLEGFFENSGKTLNATAAALKIGGMT